MECQVEKCDQSKKMFVGIGDRLRAIRKRWGLNQGQMAQRLGTTQSVLSRYENGIHRPDLDFVEALCREGINLEWFLIGAAAQKEEVPAVAEAPEKWEKGDASLAEVRDILKEIRDELRNREKLEK